MYMHTDTFASRLVDASLYENAPLAFAGIFPDADFDPDFDRYCDAVKAAVRDALATVRPLAEFGVGRIQPLHWFHPAEHNFRSDELGLEVQVTRLDLAAAFLETESRRLARGDASPWAARCLDSWSESTQWTVLPQTAGEFAVELVDAARTVRSGAFPPDAQCTLCVRLMREAAVAARSLLPDQVTNVAAMLLRERHHHSDFQVKA